MCSRDCLLDNFIFQIKTIENIQNNFWQKYIIGKDTPDILFQVMEILINNNTNKIGIYFSEKKSDQNICIIDSRHNKKFYFNMLNKKTTLNNCYLVYLKLLLCNHLLDNCLKLYTSQ